MYKIASEYLTMPYGEKVLLNVALLAIGGVLAGLTWKSEIRLRRVIYFLYMTLSFTGIYAFMSLISTSMFLKLFGVVAFFFNAIAVFLVAGYFMGIITMGRSLHLKGNRSAAWMGFVPLTNFYLLLARGQRMPDELPRSRLNRFVLDPMLVIATMIASGVASAAIHHPAGLSVTSASLPQFMESSAAKINRAGPLQIDPITWLTGAEVDGTMFTLHYQIAGNPEHLLASFRDAVAKRFCRRHSYGPAIAAGMRIHLDYRLKTDGAPFFETTITKTDCDRLSP